MLRARCSGWPISKSDRPSTRRLQALDRSTPATPARRSGRRRHCENREALIEFGRTSGSSVALGARAWRLRDIEDCSRRSRSHQRCTRSATPRRYGPASRPHVHTRTWGRPGARVLTRWVGSERPLRNPPRILRPEEADRSGSTDSTIPALGGTHDEMVVIFERENASGK